MRHDKIITELVERENYRLVISREEGRWDDVVPHFYHRHFTDALLRNRGVLLHYTGRPVDIPNSPLT